MGPLFVCRVVPDKLSKDIAQRHMNNLLNSQNTLQVDVGVVFLSICDACPASLAILPSIEGLQPSRYLDRKGAILPAVT